MKKATTTKKSSPAKGSPKLKMVDGMKLPSKQYSEYTSIKNPQEKAAWKSNYTEKSLPPFTHTYRDGKLVSAGWVKSTGKSTKKKSK